MKKYKLILLLITFSISVHAQKENISIKDKCLIIKRTEISINSFELKEAKSVYDLVLNLTYLNHVSNNIEGEYMTLPIVSIDKQPANLDSLKSINFTDVYSYQFMTKEISAALYGTSGAFGHIQILLRK